MKRKDYWWNAYAENMQNIGKNYACITADGRLFSQTEIIGILKSGADKWNSFSESLPPIRWYKRPLQWMPGFLFLIKDASLKDMNLTGYNLSGTNWEIVDFSRCKLQDIQLSSTPFRSTTIFSSCNFYRAEFTGYYNAHFKNCNFQKAELNGFHISRCEFTGNTLKKALVAGRFDKCNIENTDFSESYLSATFINIKLRYR